MTRKRHPQVADHILVSLSQGHWWFPLGNSWRESKPSHKRRSGRTSDVDKASDQVLTQTMNSLGSQGWGGSRSHQPGSRRFSSEPMCGHGESNRQNSGAVTERSHGQHPIPPPVSAASPFDPQCPLEFCNLPVWPTTGFSWPPPGNLRHRGRCGTDLQGSRNKGVWTFCQCQELTTVVWKWSLMVCPSFTSHNWPWTPRWLSRRSSQEAMCRTGWNPFGPSPWHQRAHLPRADG